LALSQQLAAPLITVDRRLVNAAIGKPFAVMHVQDVSLTW
jgi:predicted nucleic acid-binding protein